jgi:hypothetical protein
MVDEIFPKERSTGSTSNSQWRMRANPDPPMPLPFTMQPKKRLTSSCITSVIATPVVIFAYLSSPETAMIIHDKYYFVNKCIYIVVSNDY